MTQTYLESITSDCRLCDGPIDDLAAHPTAELCAGCRSEKQLANIDMMRERKAGRAVYATEKSRGEKIGNVSATYAAEILFNVALHTGYTVEAICGDGRNRGVSYARHLAMYALREHGRLSHASIGVILGGRDHTTVIDGTMRIHHEMSWRHETVLDVRAVKLLLHESEGAK